MTEYARAMRLHSYEESTRTGLSEKSIAQAFLDNLLCVYERFLEVSTVDDQYKALAHTIRDHLLHRWLQTVRTYQKVNPRTVCYLSAEYLPGPLMDNNLLSLGIKENTRQALASLGIDLNTLIAYEVEPGLGNGGLGRLASCFLDSLATLQISAIGYGIRYEFGIFSQMIRNGEQVECTDTWLRFGNPWEIRQPHIAYDVKIGGYTEWYLDSQGRSGVRWVEREVFRGVAVDTTIAGHGTKTVNLLRLWSAEAMDAFDFNVFNEGDYAGAVMRGVRSATISKILYPNDEPEIGKRLRLLQEHLFVTCSLQDMLRIHQSTGQPLESFHAKFAVQLNDTHPAIAVAELMRLLVDEHKLPWDTAWNITRQTFAYTNHTLLPEALEKWGVPLFQSVVPRHLEIVYEINSRFLDEVRERYPLDDDRLRRLSIIDETPPRFVRMAHLACVGSYAINGVADLHTRLLKETVLRDFHDLWPEKFHNKTNGVTPRRFIVLSNPGLTALLDRTLGTGWELDLGRLREIEPYADDASFQEEWQHIKRDCKSALARILSTQCDQTVDPTSIFDVQTKRIHEYKRQHLNVLHIVALYNRIKRDPAADITPRTFIFGGKAAPGYFMAKLIIRLINAVAHVVNDDADVAGRLIVVFLPNFSVKLGQSVYPAADISEQISTAGKEASGTGNMKFSMNGALTIGTLDGANVEIREAVGEENFFLFGLNAAEIVRASAAGYRPHEIYEGNPELKSAIDLIGGGAFSDGDASAFTPLVNHLLWHDTYFVLADFAAYIRCQERVTEAYRDVKRWTRMSILNVARSGRFSSDRTVDEYCREIWRVRPVPVGSQ